MDLFWVPPTFPFMRPFGDTGWLLTLEEFKSCDIEHEKLQVAFPSKSFIITIHTKWITLHEPLGMTDLMNNITDRTDDYCRDTICGCTILIRSREMLNQNRPVVMTFNRKYLKTETNAFTQRLFARLNLFRDKDFEKPFTIMYEPEEEKSIRFQYDFTQGRLQYRYQYVHGSSTANGAITNMRNCIKDLLLPHSLTPQQLLKLNRFLSHVLHDDLVLLILTYLVSSMDRWI